MFLGYFANKRLLKVNFDIFNLYFNYFEKELYLYLFACEGSMEGLIKQAKVGLRD